MLLEARHALSKYIVPEQRTKTASSAPPSPSKKAAAAKAATLTASTHTHDQQSARTQDRHSAYPQDKYGNTNGGKDKEDVVMQNGDNASAAIQNGDRVGADVDADTADADKAGGNIDGAPRETRARTAHALFAGEKTGCKGNAMQVDGEGSQDVRWGGGGAGELSMEGNYERDRGEGEEEEAEEEEEEEMNEYIAEDDETLRNIAKKYGITPEAMNAYNRCVRLCACACGDVRNYDGGGKKKKK